MFANNSAENMLRRAVELVVTNDSFRMPVEPATMALKTATCVLQWMRMKAIACESEEVITLKLCECFIGGGQDGQLFQLKRDELSFILPLTDLGGIFHTLACLLGAS